MLFLTSLVLFSCEKGPSHCEVVGNDTAYSDIPPKKRRYFSHTENEKLTFLHELNGIVDTQNYIVKTVDSFPNFFYRLEESCARPYLGKFNKKIVLLNENGSDSILIGNYSFLERRESVFNNHVIIEKGEFNTITTNSIFRRKDTVINDVHYKDIKCLSTFLLSKDNKIVLMLFLRPDSIGGLPKREIWTVF